MVSEKFSSKNSKFYRECIAHEIFCHPAISQFLMADVSFNNACKEVKIAQIAQFNQLFRLLHLVHIYGCGFYELPVSRMLMRKNVNYDVSKDSPIVVLNMGFITPWLYFTQSSHHFSSYPWLSKSGNWYVVVQFSWSLVSLQTELDTTQSHYSFCTFSLYTGGRGLPRKGGGRDYHIKVTGMLVVSLTDVNCRLWSHLECLGWKVTVFAHLGIA